MYVYICIYICTYMYKYIYIIVDIWGESGDIRYI